MTKVEAGRAEAERLKLNRIASRLVAIGEQLNRLEKSARPLSKPDAETIAGLARIAWDLAAKMDPVGGWR